MHLLKRYLRRYLYFLYSKTVSMMYPLPSESFHWLSTFQADDWPIRTDFHWCYPRLEKSKATIFSNFTTFCEISNDKTHKAKVFLLNVWNSFANVLLKCWNFAKLVFISCFHVKWVMRFSRFDHLVNRDLTLWYSSWPQLSWCKYLATTMNSWVGFVSSIFLYFKLVATLTLEFTPDFKITSDLFKVAVSW